MTTNDRALLTLMNWFSPAYPVGAFAWSHGLEQAVADGVIKDADSLQDWVDGVLRHGAGRTDAILLCAAWRAVDTGDEAALEDVCALAKAYRPTREMRAETLQQGEAFIRTARETHGAIAHLDADCGYAVAVGAYCALADIELSRSALFYLNAMAANLVLAALRLAPIGQTQGQIVLQSLQIPVATLAWEAVDADLDDLGGCAFGVEIASMRHETLYSRLFRS